MDCSAQGRDTDAKRNAEKALFSGCGDRALQRACAAFILVMIFLGPHAAEPEDKGNKTEYVTEIDGYEMADLSMYGNLRVYDLLDANGFTDYEGSGYNRSLPLRC